MQDQQLQIDDANMAQIMAGLLQRVETLEKQVGTYLDKRRRLLGAEHSDVIKVQKMGESPR